FNPLSRSPTSSEWLMHPELVLENVRCFAGEHRVPLAPLTFLVGENSTGKSTVLGAAQFVTTALRAPPEFSLNQPPFSFGNFNDILSDVGVGGPDYFTVG